MDNSMYNSSDNTKMKKATLDDKHQVIRDIGKSGYMMRLIISSCLTLIFFIWETFQIFAAMIKISDNSLTSTASYSLGFSAILGTLMSQLGLFLAIFSIATIIRVLPVVSFIAIYVKSKKYNSTESLFPFLTVMQVFGVLEAIIWGGLLIYDIVNFIKYQIPIFSDNGIYTMIIVVFLLIMVFKAVQGIMLQFFIIYIRNYINNGYCPKKYFNIIKFSFVMLATLNAIVFSFIVGSVAITQGIDIFFKTFPQLWPIYLFFFAQMFGNICATSFLNTFRSRTRRLEFGAAPAPTTYSTRPFNSPYPTEQNKPAYQNQPANNGYAQNGNQYQNRQSFGGYQQNNSPYQNQPANNNYAQNGNQYQNRQNFGGYQQNNSPYQNQPVNNGYTQNSAPFQDISQSGSPFQDIPFSDNYQEQQSYSGNSRSSKPFEDLFTYKDSDQ